MSGLLIMWSLFFVAVVGVGVACAIAVGVVAGLVRAAARLARWARTRRDDGRPDDELGLLDPATSPHRAIVGPPPHRRHPTCSVVRHPVRTDTKELPRARVQ